ncbi:MAG: NAD-dependent epimerase/dehydratase family protein [Neomegalonema sp.]|nr:NAD-dependent epimerase/dehydratase family protein [Neomegalonema sp.]
MATYLVTGGAGFIGSHIASSLLADGHHVRILDDLSTGSEQKAPKDAELLIGDVCDEKLLKAAVSGCSGIFHMAAVASVQRCNEEWLASHRTNLSGTIAVYEAAKHVGGIPVAWASSSAIYGDTEDCPISEATRPHPLTAYGADKRGGELHGRAAASIHGVPNTALRLFNVYGPRQDASSPYSGVIALFANKISHGAPVTIFGDGQHSRDFVYVADVVAAFRAAMDRMLARKQAGEPALGDISNVCTGRETTVLELAQTLKALLKSQSEIGFGPERAGDIKRSLGDPTHMNALLGVTAQTPLREGLQKLLDTIKPVNAAA